MPVAARRLVIALLLLVAGLAAFGLTRLDSSAPPTTDGIIESLTPGPNEKTLQQGQVTVDLLTGWDATLSIDQRPIPDDQLVKVREQGKLTFQPGPGKAFEVFPPGQNCATVTYWQVATGRDTSFSKTWCFNVAA